MKKKIKVAVFILFSIWVVLGIAARMDMRYLADKYRSDGFDDWVINSSDPNCKFNFYLYEKYADKYSKENFEISESLIKDNIIFGFKFNDKMYWLSDEENKKMHDLLLDSYWSYLPIYHDEPRFYGFFYACPKWANYLELKNILLPFLPLIHVYYYPLKEHMYIGQENGILDADFCDSINITNIQPSLVHIDKKTIEEAAIMIKERERNRNPQIESP